MLSLLEIVYHATLRLFCKSYRHRYNRQKMSGDGIFNERQRSAGWNNDDDTHTVKYPDERSTNNGFLRKLFQRSYILGKNSASVTNDNMSKFNNSVGNTIKQHGNVPMFLRTPLGSDFHKPYLATLWEIQEPAPIVLTERDRNY